MITHFCGGLGESSHLGIYYSTLNNKYTNKNLDSLQECANNKMTKQKLTFSQIAAASQNVHRSVAFARLFHISL